MKRFTSIAAGLMLAGLLAAPLAAAPAYQADDQEYAFLELINAYRAENGLGALVLQDELGAAADYHSWDMGTNNYFDHYLSDGTSPGQNIANFGYTGDTWGENIAAGMGDASDVLYQWQVSPDHNAAMLSGAYTEIGIGREYVEGSYYGWYWTTTFGGGEAVTEQGVAPTVNADGSEVYTPTADENTVINEQPSVIYGESASTDQGVIDAAQDIAPTINGVPVTSGNYEVDGGAVYDAGGDYVGANADGDTIYTGDLTGSGTYNADGGTSNGTIYNADGTTILGGSTSAPVTTTDTEYTESGGLVTTTTTVTGIDNSSGNAQERGNPNGTGATSAPGTVNLGN